MDMNFNEIDAILPDDFDINDPNYSLDNAPDSTDPTTSQTSEINDPEVQVDAAPAGPTTTQEPVIETPVPQTVRVKYNHEERELTLDEATTYAQKGMNYDKLEERVRGYEAANARSERMARALGYKDSAEMMDAAEKNYYNRRVRQLVEAGNTEAMARFLVDQEDKANSESTPTPAQAPTAQVPNAPAPGLTPERKAELDEFIVAYPGVTKLPTEVIVANRNGVRLKDAYSAYMSKQQATPAPTQPQTSTQQAAVSEVEKLRSENQILKQNQASAAMAPVTGVTGKPPTDDIVDPLENDPFMKGFNSEKW